jgi:adenosylhomocysteine nucleosidase
MLAGTVGLRPVNGEHAASGSARLPLVNAVRRVGVLTPMPSELAPVVKTMGLTRADAHGPPVHVGRVGVVDVVATRTGMGLTLAADATNALLDHHELDHVLVVGIAGGIGDTRVGEVLRPAVAVDRSTGTPYEATPLVGVLAGVVSSSDEFLVDPDRVAALVAEGVRALDMETAAVASVCAGRGVPWSAVRVISDLSSDHPDASVLDLAHPDGTPNPRAAIPFLLRNPGRIPGLLKLGRDSMRAARAAANEAHRQLSALR